MPASGKNRPTGRKPTIRPAKTLLLRDISLESAVARRPVVPTHASGITSHARRHVPRHAQS